MKKILSVLLALVMVLSMIPVIASAAEGTWTLVTDASTLKAGDQIIIAAKDYNYALSTTQNSNNRGQASITKSGNTATISNAVEVITLENGTTAGTFAFKVANGYLYCASTSSKNYLRTQSSIDEKASWSINIAATGAATVTSQVSGINRNKLYYNQSSSLFACYSSVQKDICLYKLVTNDAPNPDEPDCEHTNTNTTTVDATCTAAGSTTVTCADCGETVSTTTIDALGHTNDEGVVTNPTCLKDGYTTYTCTVCGTTTKGDYVDATGHSYVDGVCSACGLELPTDLEGLYYIAAIRSTGNYQYMTNDVGTTEGKPRYQIVDSGVTELPESIEEVVETQLFELIEVEGGYVIKTGNKYLGWTSGNYGVVVDEADAKVVTIEYGETEGSYNIHFTASETDERYLALNSNADYAYYAWYVGVGNQITDLFLVPISETAEICEHTNATTEGAVKPDCTTEGATGATVCPDCGVTIQANEVIPALGHDYVDGICSVCGAEKPEVPSEATITFDDATKRTEFSTAIQVWEENGVKVTNNKASSTSNVADYVKPARFYKSSTVTVEYPGMTKIVVACNSTDYAKALGSSVSGAIVDGKIVTIELASAVDEFTFTCSAQIRVDSLTVYTSKVCNHVWGDAVQTLAPNCAEEGENTYTCTLCGETKTEHVAALGHVIENGVCSVCSGNIYPLVTTLNENDNVILYNPANKVAMANTVNSYNKMDSLSAAASNGIAVQDGMAIMQVKYVEGSETDFYLMLDGKYLNAGETGNKMYLTEEADDYAIWYMKVIDEAEGLVYLNSRNAKYNDNFQSVEYYNGSFTTYSGSGDAFKMKLYAVAGEAEPVAPSIELTHISLDPNNDALGFKAAATNAPEGAQVEISLWVDGGNTVTRTANKDNISLRLKNIMANNGGETTIYAKVVLKDAEGNVIAESQVAETSMKDAIIAVNGMTLTSDQQTAVGKLYAAYESVMSAWFAEGETNNIASWKPTEA